MTDIARRLPSRIATLVRAAALSLAALLCAPVHADSPSRVVERDGKAWLYLDGKPLTPGYDSLSIEQTEGYPDLVIAARNDLYGVLDAHTGHVVLPLQYRGVVLDTLSSIRLIEARTETGVLFFTSDGKPADMPAYSAVSDFTPARGGDWQAFAERDGKLYVVTVNQGRFVSEAYAPRYFPLVIMPPELRRARAAHDGPLDGVYVPQTYADLQAAWDGWKRGELREAGQPAIVVRGDTAYVSFGEFASDAIPLMPNTLRACQTTTGLALREDDKAGGCASKSGPLMSFQRDSSGALRCVDCSGPLAVKWVPLPSVTHSLVGIGVALQKKPNDHAATVVGLLPGGPAQSKLQAGDRVTGVDGKAVEALTLAQIVDVIRGEAGTAVKLDVTRGAQTLTVEIVRRKVDVTTDVAGL